MARGVKQKAGREDSKGPEQSRAMRYLPDIPYYPSKSFISQPRTSFKSPSEEFWPKEIDCTVGASGNEASAVDAMESATSRVWGHSCYDTLCVWAMWGVWGTLLLRGVQGGQYGPSKRDSVPGFSNFRPQL
jgi:hypothetical protein